MKCEAVYVEDRGTVRFAVYPEGFDGPRVLAEVSEDFLREVYGAGPDPADLVHACELHFDSLERMVRRRFRLDPRQAMLVVSQDLGFLDLAWP